VKSALQIVGYMIDCGWLHDRLRCMCDNERMMVMTGKQTVF